MPAAKTMCERRNGPTRGMRVTVGAVQVVGVWHGTKQICPGQSPQDKKKKKLKRNSRNRHSWSDAELIGSGNTVITAEGVESASTTWVIWPVDLVVGMRALQGGTQSGRPDDALLGISWASA